jgi:NAD(P)-dependent dehydrogenase (short-subunit alcohol dehydrogenase family)
MGDCTGRRILITGANSGIGREAARELVAKGASVVLACRDRARGAAAAAGMTGPGEATVRELDLADLGSVREVAAAVAGAGAPLDGLVANAGVMACPFRLSSDGYELQMATNHLGHALLVGLLWPALAPAARVVLVTSLAARGGRLSAATTRDDLVAPAPYSKQGVYSNTKQANLLFSQELHRRSRAAGSDVVVLAAHPGVSYSELFPRQLRDGGLGWLVPVLRPGMRIALQSSHAGGLPLLRALTDPALRGGEMVAPRHFHQVRGAPEVVPVFRTGSDPAAAAHLWELTEEILGTPLLR